MWKILQFTAKALMESPEKYNVTETTIHIDRWFILNCFGIEKKRIQFVT